MAQFRVIGPWPGRTPITNCPVPHPTLRSRSAFCLPGDRLGASYPAELCTRLLSLWESMSCCRIDVGSTAKRQHFDSKVPISKSPRSGYVKVKTDDGQVGWVLKRNVTETEAKN